MSIMSMVKGAVLKVCGCGARYTKKEWVGLPYAYTEEYPDVHYEFRHCTCISTIGVQVVDGVYQHGGLA